MFIKECHKFLIDQMVYTVKIFNTHNFQNSIIIHNFFLKKNNNNYNMGSERPSKKRDLNALNLNNSSSDNYYNPETMEVSESKAKVKPLIILDLKQLKSNQSELSEKLNSWLGDSQATVKFTFNNNLLIYPKTEEDRVQLLGKTLNYENKKIIELAPKGIELVMKGLTYKETQIFSSELKKSNLTNLKEMKSHVNPTIDLKRVRVSCQDQSAADTLLKNGIYVNYQKFNFELYNHKIKVTQCYNCQQLGHISKSCPQGKICVSCSSNNHDIDDNGKPICNSETKFCILCKGEHSNAYSRCPVKIDKINEIASRRNGTYATIVKDRSEKISNVRNFNTFVEEIKQEMKKESSSIIEKIDELKKSFDEKISELEKKLSDQKIEIEELKTKLGRSSRNITDNNNLIKKISTGLIDYLYICNPKCASDDSFSKNLSTFLKTIDCNKSSSDIKARIKQISKNN